MKRQTKRHIYLIDPNPNTGFVRKQVIAIKRKSGEGRTESGERIVR